MGSDSEIVDPEVDPEFDYRNKKVCCALSAGINSMALAVWLSNYEYKPKDIYVFYAHFEEHSPESLEFVLAGVEYLKKHFTNVIFESTNNSIIKFFESEKMIPHPMYSPCTNKLKIEPVTRFLSKHGCTIDLVGYVRTEKRRVNKMMSKGVNDLFLSKHFPILDLSDEDCFKLVKKEIGWYPRIYDLSWSDAGFINFVQNKLTLFDEYLKRKILKKLGTNKKVFLHNNCLPCKNNQVDDLLGVEYFYPEYYKKAMGLSKKLKSHWGRDKDSFTDVFMTTFGRQDYEVEGGCKVCEF
jgi:3'-phosphoadenosine 5'-phosphosulfate sulfotransferase (PAPS reductase)/FAD synthetase